MSDAASDSVDVFLDEAGYTGPDLTNRDQPVFVLASSVMGDEVARDLIAQFFKSYGEGELKHSRLSGVKRWRAEAIEFLKALPRDKVTVRIVHKEFALLSFLVDFWVEPLAHQDGVNLYERGANIALSNVAYVTLTATLGEAGRRELLRRFQVMTRDRTPFAYDNFWTSLYGAVRRHKLIEDALGVLVVAERRLGWRHLLRLPQDLLDLGDHGLLETVDYWRKLLPGRTLALIHDESKMVQRHRRLWEAILDPANPPAVVGQDRRTIEFPLPVSQLRLADSNGYRGLQVADVVAGAVCTVLREKAGGRSSPYARNLATTDVLDIISGGVWPSDAVTPHELDTEGPALGDSADFIASLVQRHKIEQ